MKPENTLVMIAKFLLLSALGSLAVSCASVSADGKLIPSADGRITLQELLIKKTIRVSDLKKLNLDVKEGHGPALWAALDDKQDVLFYYEPGILSVLGITKIILIATVKPNDENHGTIIWPADKVGHDYGKELRILYKKEK